MVEKHKSPVGREAAIFPAILDGFLDFLTSTVP
jgi:hypothetical protein